MNGNFSQHSAFAHLMIVVIFRLNKYRQSWINRLYQPQKNQALDVV